MDAHPTRLNNKQRNYLKKIIEMLNNLDRGYVGSILEYEDINGTTSRKNIDSTIRVIEYILRDGTYRPEQIRYLNNLKGLYYELRKLHDDPVNLKWDFLYWKIDVSTI